LQETNVLDQFTEWLKQVGKSPSTVSTYQREIQKYQDWLQQYSIYLEDISQKDVQSYVSFLEQQGKSPVTIDKILGAIRTFAKFLKKPDIIIDIAVVPVEKKEEIEVLTPLECEQLFREVKKDGHNRNIAIVYLLLHTGIRVSELCSLNKSDIDFERNLVLVKHNSTGEERAIPLSDDSRTYLQRHIELNRIEDALFVSKSNERLSERSVQYMLKKYQVNPHKLRHTFCQLLVDKGVALEIVSELAGHKDINVTKRYAKSRMKQLELEKAIQNTFSNDTLG